MLCESDNPGFYYLDLFVKFKAQNVSDCFHSGAMCPHHPRKKMNETKADKFGWGKNYTFYTEKRFLMTGFGSISILLPRKCNLHIIVFNQNGGLWMELIRLSDTSPHVPHHSVYMQLFHSGLQTLRIAFKGSSECGIIWKWKVGWNS